MLQHHSGKTSVLAGPVLAWECLSALPSNPHNRPELIPFSWNRRGESTPSSSEKTKPASAATAERNTSGFSFACCALNPALDIGSPLRCPSRNLLCGPKPPRDARQRAPKGMGLPPGAGRNGPRRAERAQPWVTVGQPGPDAARYNVERCSMGADRPTQIGKCTPEHRTN